MDYPKEAEKPHSFEYILFVLLGILVLYLFLQLFGLTGFTITGNVVSENQDEQIATINSIIEVTDAEHFGSDYVSNIYDEIKAPDGIWSEEIYDGDYVRVVFQENLTREKDITVYPRIISGEPRIEVYEKDENEIIAKFDNLINNRYNKIFLDGSSGVGLEDRNQDTFDLHIVGGSVEFDHIYDPVENITNFTAGGTYTVFPGVTEIIVRAWGGGGGGGGSSTNNLGGSGGGGGSSEIKYECTENGECLEDEVCLTGQCIKLFDIKIIEFKSPVKLGEFFEFIYYVKGMANINGDVIVDFWIERNGEKITSGSDVIYLGEFEEKTESTKIFLPRNVESGVYQFFVQVSYGSYIVSSHRTIELEVGEGIATLGPTEEPRISIPLIVVIIILLFLLSGGRLQRHRREKKRTELGNLIKVFEKDIGQNIFHKDYIKPHERKKIQRTKHADEVGLIEEAIKKTEEKNKARKNAIELIEEASKKNIKEENSQAEAKMSSASVAELEQKPQKPEKELIEEAVEETEKKNKGRKTVEELIEEARKIAEEEKNNAEKIEEKETLPGEAELEKKEQTDDEYYESLFKQ